MELLTQSEKLEVKTQCINGISNFPLLHCVFTFFFVNYSVYKTVMIFATDLKTEYLGNNKIFQKKC